MMCEEFWKNLNARSKKSELGNIKKTRIYRRAKLKKTGNFFVILIGLLFFSWPVFGATIKFDATVDQNQLTVDDNLTLTLTLTSDGGVNEDEPTLPDLSGFEVL